MKNHKPHAAERAPLPPEKRRADIIFYSPYGDDLAPDKIGGTECASLKTISILTEAGFRIVPLRKPVRAKRLFPYLVRMLSTWAGLLRLLFAHRKAVLHVVGVYRGLMYAEWAFIVSAKTLGHKTVYDLRNGDMVKEYERRGRLYRRGMLSLLRHSDSILCQGTDYVRFVREKLDRPSFYYPNFLQERFMEKEYPQRDTRRCRLVYFGRIVPQKNIGLILRICGLLHERGLSPALELIGGCPDVYKEELEAERKRAGLPDGSVRFRGRMEFKSFFPCLKKCHFFLFPSDEPREGHSNALTEAMGCGVVPVVSEAGFNRQVVDDDTLVAPRPTAAAYADIVCRVWTSGEWEAYSRRMHARVAECFSEGSVRGTLLAAYGLTDSPRTP